jgi:uncharacterized membrane protein
VISPRTIVWLLIGALGLPIVLCVLLGLARLLEAMQDQSGAVVVGRFALAVGVLWVVDLIALLILQTIHGLPRASSKDEEN